MKSLDLVEKFKSIGFKEYEAKIFLVLLKGLPLSAGEIAKEAKLVRTSIYDSLKTFTDKGYCNEIETNTVLKYQIIEPKVLVDKLEKDFNELNNARVASLKETFNEAAVQSGYGSNSSPEKDDSVQLIRGFNKHRVEKYISLVNNAKKEILGMNSIKGIVTDELESSAKKLINSGGAVKYIYKISVDFKIKKDGRVTQATKEDLVGLCETFEKSGEQVRLTNMEIPNIGIFDGSIAYVNIKSNISDAGNKQSDLIIKNSGFVKNLKDMFEYYWQNSITVKEFKSNKNL